MICFIDVKLFLEICSKKKVTNAQIVNSGGHACHFHVTLQTKRPFLKKYFTEKPRGSSFQTMTATDELYDFCLQEKIADQNLIAKWKKQGYENLCCLRCIQTRDTNFGTSCICRVPKSKLEEGRIVECVHCGCRGCSG
ncbi:protein BUD31 homolog isoform X2 [Acyrthosiphon pisum]|uniref:Protein BUD31 homolog n=1 Tax=Acyrthosiphon pisum TaxID=7029 RepID=A0A8R2H3F0_ACYPI|nr:protein BUD31 homolog isoform X2 [Acyrthosiphon pisum]|eukprot:XP_016656504.1 PREDICTED: protein BUD31 homolog isoform X2 [Acyrthosiphon pisum]